MNNFDFEKALQQDRDAKAEQRDKVFGAPANLLGNQAPMVQQ